MEYRNGGEITPFNPHFAAGKGYTLRRRFQLLFSFSRLSLNRGCYAATTEELNGSSYAGAGTAKTLFEPD